MHFENYAKRINSVKDIEIFGQLLQEKQEQNRFVVKNNNMYLEKIKKTKFAQTNERRHFFSNGIVSLPFFHPFLSQFVTYKESKKEKIANYIFKNKEKLLVMEKDVLLKHDWLSLY